jgi:sugar lactone lactonase YvrE
MSCYPMTACIVTGLSEQPPCYWSTSTLAGNSVSGYADGVGTNAYFNRAMAISYNFLNDSFYIGDELWNNKIRQISPGGVVTTFADGLGCPVGTDFDLSGNLYVADWDTNWIKKITPLGVKSLFASVARLPADVAVNASGFVFIAQNDQNAVNVASPTGVVKRVAGSGAAAFADGIGTFAIFKSPWALCLDPKNNVYVADSGNNRIRFIAYPSLTVTTIVGDGTAARADGIGTAASTNSPTGITYDKISSVVYFTENTAVRKIIGNFVSTIAGSSSASYMEGFGSMARFLAIAKLTLDNKGAIFTCDVLGNRVRKLTCVPCPASYYCLSGVPVICPVGLFCPLSSINPISSPPGTFSPIPGSSSPTPCFPGTYNPLFNQTSCLQCEPGYFCPSNSSTMTPCGLSNYCPRGSSSPTPCPLFMAVDASLGPANGPAYDVDTAACLAHCYSGGPDQTSRC